MRPLLAEFTDPDALLAALGEVRRAGHRGLDAYTPFPIKGLGELFDPRPSRIRLAMLLAGVAAAVAAYAVQWWSAVYDYPQNLGGRPLNSWPVFLLVPFEVGIFAAALGGIVAFLAACGLPRLHHPLFAAPRFERATQDRYFLLAAPDRPDRGPDLRHLLEGAGALLVSEVQP